MKIALCSAFRDSTPYLNRYLHQVAGLGEALAQQGMDLECVWGEGDSRDHTLTALRAVRMIWPVTQVDCSHGGPAFDSVVNPDRFRQLAHVGKQIFAAIPDDADVAVYVESDLIWEPAALLTLVERIAIDEYEAMAPMVYLRREGWPADSFYDVYCFRAGGQPFAHHPPYHPRYRAREIFTVESAGSCLAMRGAMARRLIFDEQTIFSDLCGQIRASGASIWVDPTLACYHH